MPGVPNMAHSIPARACREARSSKNLPQPNHAEVTCSLHNELAAVHLITPPAFHAPPAGPLKLTGPQRRALFATKLGKVTRNYTAMGDTLAHPTIGAKALWNVYNAGLIKDGLKQSSTTTIMILTPRGEAAIGSD
jgi:hypothetical protein